MALTLAQIRTKIDGVLTTLWPKLVTRQTTYAANHGGNYWQGLITHSVIPTEGDDFAPDRLASHPTDQLASWADAISTDLPATLPMALIVDVYDGPAGKGFIATVLVRVLGSLYARSQNYGPETWLTVAWHQVA